MTIEELGQYAARDYLTKVAWAPAGVQEMANTNLADATKKQRNAAFKQGLPGTVKTRARSAPVAAGMGWGGKAAIGAGILGAGALAHKVLSSPDPQQR